MFREEKNIKDTPANSSASHDISIKDISAFNLSYTKTHKLITALYMVTDIIDKDEPLRNKLRTLGAEIISDINANPFNSLSKISIVLSFLDIASAVNIISAMNCNILKKEFLELSESIKDYADQSGNKAYSLNRQINLSDFFREELSVPAESRAGEIYQPAAVRENDIGHGRSNSIGVQKGSTLMKALSGVQIVRRGAYESNSKAGSSSVFNFDILKKQRRDTIINIIKKNGGSATIKDIMLRTNTGARGTVSFSEKTLQRELMSMTKEGVLKKTGEKRWSKYLIP